MLSHESPIMRGQSGPFHGGEGDGAPRMTQFLGTHLNKLDAKGRVSIPAGFRAALREVPALPGVGGSAIYLRRSHIYPCIDVWPPGMLQKAAARLETLDPMSPEHDDLAARVYGDSLPAEPDKEGRIVVPERYLAHAGITEQVAVTGRGLYFQLWEPKAGDARLAEVYAKTGVRAT